MTDRYPDNVTRLVDDADFSWHDHPTDRMPPSRRPRVTHLVLVDGLPADHWVDESGDSSWSHPGHPDLALRGQALAHRHGYDPPHARELRWLESLVGGREPLLALDTVPLVTPADIRLPPALADQSSRVDEIRRACARHAASVFHDPELPAATHHTLEAALHADPACLTRSDRDSSVVGAVLWVAGHANGLIGPAGEVLARELWERIGVSASAASRGATMLHRLQCSAPGHSPDPWVDSLAPFGSPRLKPTAHAALLTSATRAMLIGRRDAALAAGVG